MVLLDMWVVTRYTGEPQGLDGQALRWCAQEDLAAADLLPADKPIVAALRLPERLREVSTPFYRVGAAGETVDASSEAAGAAGEAVGVAGNDGRLRGAFCANAAAAVAAARAGADFLVLVAELPDERIAELCRSVPKPVYVRGIPLESAWRLGASGINEIPL